MKPGLKAGMTCTESEKRPADDEREAKLLLQEDGEVFEQPWTQIVGIGEVATQQWRDGARSESRDRSALADGHGEEEEARVSCNRATVAVVCDECFDERVVTITEPPDETQDDRHVIVLDKGEYKHKDRVH